MVLLHRRPLALDGNGSRTVVGMPGPLQGLLGTAEMRQTPRCHHLGGLPHRRFFDLSHLARRERPGVQWPPGWSPRSRAWCALHAAARV